MHIHAVRLAKRLPRNASGPEMAGHSATHDVLARAQLRRGA